jgi:hypothetical protein
MKRNLNEYMDAKRSALIDPSWEDVDCLLAALEEAQQQLTTAKEERDSQQRVCIKVMEELAEAQQTIARLTEALDFIASMKIVGAAHVSMQAIARGGLNRETQIVQKCERCGCNYVKKDDSYVCGFCLDELEEEEGSDKA